MIKSLKIINFRSIKKALDIELAPITMVYGGNGAGKSSLLYSMFILKSILLNSNRPLDAFFNLSIANLGGFEQVVFDHRKDKTMVLGISLELEQTQLRYDVSIGLDKGEFVLEAKGDWNLKVSLTVTFPYPANQQAEFNLKVGEHEYAGTWNGLTASLTSPADATAEVREEAEKINALLNLLGESLRKVDIVPLRRGFFKPQYQQVATSPDLVGEDEVATIIAQDPYLPGKLSIYLQAITNREFRIHVPLGTSFFYLQTVERSTGLTTELVNDGFGTNQLVYFLAKSLRSDARLVCVEEPEINLHPMSIHGLVQAMVRMVKKEDKQFLITTHSESLVLALLSQVARRKLKPSELACYLATKTGKVTQFERQDVTAKGQVEGGLKSFMEAELEDIKAFLGA